MNHADGTLLAKADELCQDPAFRNAVWRHCAHRAQDADIGRLSTRIHPEDQMLRHSLRHFQEVNRSLSQYFNVALQQHAAAQQIMQLLFGERDGDFSILDFACGYGRLLRFLTLDIPPARIWASDIQRDAVDFVAREFRVHAVHSGFEPDDFRTPARFDFIWVASLFSHLPAHLFRKWFARLMAQLKPDGVLCFSVHDECLLAGELDMPQEGLHFLSTSEIEELDNRAYGTSFVSESFVRKVIARVHANSEPGYFRLKRGLANEQDIYVVPAEAGRDLSALEKFHRGTWGWVDECRIAEDGALAMHGWAASLDGGTLDSVAISVDGETFACPTGRIREDVAAVLGDARFATSGWAFSHQLAGASAFVEVSARTDAAGQALLYAGPVQVPVRAADPTAGTAAGTAAGKRTIAQRVEALVGRMRR